MAFKVMDSQQPKQDNELPWVEEWTNSVDELACFPRRVLVVKAVKSGKGFLVECDTFIAFCYKKDSRAVFIDQYLRQFYNKPEAPSLKILPCKDNPKFWMPGIDDDMAVALVSPESGWRTDLIPVMAENQITGKMATKAYTHPDIPIEPAQPNDAQPSAPKRARKSAKNDLQDA